MIKLGHFLIFSLFLKYSTQDNVIDICFPENGVFKNYFPLINQSDYNLYSVSNGQRTGRPIIAYLCTRGTNQPLNLKNPKYAKIPEMFNATSQPTSTDTDCIDNHPTASIKMCQYAADDNELHDPRRFDKSKMRKVCSEAKTTLSELIIPNVKIHDVYLVIQGLSHEILDSDEQFCLERRIVFSIFVQGKTIVKATNSFKIFSWIPRLKWSQRPNDEIIANHPFNMSLIIVNDQDEIITTGLDSTLIVEVTITFVVKMFARDALVRDYLYTTEVKLAGDEVVTSLRNYDQVLHKRANKGFVQFNNVVILDVYERRSLHLNATLLVPLTGDRQPLDYSDLSSSCFTYQKPQEWQFSCLEFCDYVKCFCPNDNGERSTLGLYKLVMCETRIESKAITFTALKITAQRAAGLHLIDSELENNTDISNAKDLPNPEKKLNVISNFQIPNLWVIVIDNENRRIFSGEDSVLTIYTIVDPENIQLLGNVSFSTHRGLGRFMGAVKGVANVVKFAFTTTTKRGDKLTSSFSHPFQINGIINFLMFGRFNTAGLKGDPDPVTASYAQMAVNDINNNFYPELDILSQSNLTIDLEFCDHEQSFMKSADLFLTSIENSLGGVAGIIAFGDNSIAANMHGLVESYNIPVIAYREDRVQFIRKDVYQTTFCLDWTYGHIGPFIGEALQTKWNFAILIQDEYGSADKNARDGVRTTFNYIIAHRMIILNQKNLTVEIEKAKNIGAKVVLCFVRAPKQYFLFREAINNKFAPMHGYQWFALEQRAKEFDWNNEHHYCSKKPKCTEAFEGMQMLISTHNLSGYSTPWWYHVNRNFYEGNPVEFHGFPMTYSYLDMEQFALGYDAVLTLAHALVKQIKSSKVITKTSTIKSIHGLSFDGLTGFVQFSKTGNWRMQPIMALMNVVHHTPQNVARWLVISDLYTKHFIEEKYFREKRSINRHKNLQIGKEGNLRQVIEIPIEFPHDLFHPHKMAYKPMVFPNESLLIPHYYLSTRGYLSKEANFISDNPTNVKTICLRTELTVAPYHCADSCGGGRLYTDSVVEYKHGMCYLPNECSCHSMGHVIVNIPKEEKNLLAYSGEHCQNIMCKACYNGECASPNNCSCEKGWLGAECDVADCPSGCNKGTCISPDHCVCDVGYYGFDCNILLGLLLPLVIVSAIVLSIVLGICIRIIKKRTARYQDLQNLDWLVDWREVIESVAPSSLLTPASTILGVQAGDVYMPSVRRLSVNISGGGLTGVITPSSYLENTAIWKGQNCFIKRFDRDSLDANSVLIRKEIVELKHVKHQNLVRFYGACLTAPNVCILLEILPKGNLAEILQTELFNISWAFKFSILKDIAVGMDYLHKSKIGSHGHLKSKNCLLDNRWTCKISGFGVPILRRKIYTSDENYEVLMKAMLWTAPELLSKCMTPNDIENGTQLGDVYSFGIIVTEMCTHDWPFSYELQMLSIDELIRLLRNFNDPANRGIRKLLDTNHYDTSLPIRPAIMQSQLPESYKEKKGLKELIVNTTNEDPELRPTFKGVISNVSKIHSLEGDLIENLLHMLEKYANHLEDMLSEKVTQVETEKNKIEELFSRLVPISIAQQIKLKLEVPPEYHAKATFLYSGLVGFTTVTKYSTPMEVVELLNDIYIAFDSIIEDFNVHKFDSLGGTYCLASGIPNAVVDHYEQIATLSLHLVSTVDKFTIDNKQREKLKIRIGIHSGSCVAGVVGTNMPRYCIYGEDIMIAQCMEWQGEPNCIQLSESTAQLLDDVGIYFMAYRGKMNIEFVGTVHTFWLIGKEGIQVYVPMTPVPTDSESNVSLAASSEFRIDRNAKLSVLSEFYDSQVGNVKPGTIKDLNFEFKKSEKRLDLTVSSEESRLESHNIDDRRNESEDINSVVDSEVIESSSVENEDQ